jgi:hypothetical protein
MVVGDNATIDGGRCETIMDRNKDLIFNEAGKNMSPADLEQKLKASSPPIIRAIRTRAAALDGLADDRAWLAGGEPACWPLTVLRDMPSDHAPASIGITTLGDITDLDVRAYGIVGAESSDPAPDNGVRERFSAPAELDHAIPGCRHLCRRKHEQRTDSRAPP